MATTKYNPYKAAQKITDLKGKYHNARQMNDNYQQYADEAVQYYAELYNNGEKELADRLAAVDYRGASDILAGLPTEEDVAFNEWYDNIGKVASGDKRTVSEQQSSYIDKLMGIGTGETQVTPTQAATDLLDMVKSNDAIYNDSYTQFQNNVMSGANDLLNYDYTQQSFYQPIMDSYNLFGENAANGALASGASGNAGNIDSYAAANAARQQLAFTNAGHQAALAAAAQNQGGWLDAFRLSKDALGDLRLKNADIGNIYTHQVTTDANERQAANDVIRQLFGDESAERTNATNAMVDKYLADLGLVQTQYVTDADERMNTANNEYGLALQQLANESGLSVAQLQAAVDNYKAQLQYDSALANYAAQERMNTADNTAARSKQYYENKYAQEQAERDFENQVKLEELKSQYNGAASALEAQTQAEIEDFVSFAIGQIGSEGSGVSNLNDVRKSAITKFGNKYSDIIDNALNIYKKYSDS